MEKIKLKKENLKKDQEFLEKLESNDFKSLREMPEFYGVPDR